MSEPKLLTVPQVAAELQVTAQTIRNWIDHGTLPAVRIGRAFRVKRADVDALLERASADSTSLATRRDLWQPPPQPCHTATPQISHDRSGTTPPNPCQPTSRRSRPARYAERRARARGKRPLARSSASTATASSPATSASSSYATATAIRSVPVAARLSSLTAPSNRRHNSPGHDARNPAATHTAAHSTTPDAAATQTQPHPPHDKPVPPPAPRQKDPTTAH